ncbi:MAG: HD domain-containing protein [Ruminococcus sp.]|nr:HD domain-containing protein [Ruminococcus sp.]MCM1381134.1 HD domain-containing protein [Muribaculaceae bacterium]MCM1479806.1 HD domain-containing protein [Muribaculaceae bacterium]
MAFPVVLAIFAIFFVNTVSAEELPYVRTVFNERNGLPTGEANDVLQTSDGYVWVGSYGGLIRYDGTEFRNFSSEGILPSSSVRMMFEDSSGRLWIGTNDAGVFVYGGGEISQPEGQPRDNFLCVRGFAEGADGVIYACSNSGIAEIRDGVMTVYNIPELTGQTVYSVAADKFGRVWGAESSGGCAVIKDGKLEGIISGEVFFGEGETVYSLAAGADGDVWLGSANTEAARVGFASEDLTDGFETEIFTFENVSTHNSMRMMKDGTVTVSGLHGFGIICPDGSVKEIGESEGAESLNSAYIDYEGNIWLASTSEGIVRYSVGCYSTPNAAAGLEDVTLNAVTVSGGVKYIGTDSGVIVCGEDWQRQDCPLTDLLEGIRVRHIIADSKGRIWTASYSDKPVIMYDPSSGETTVYSSEDGLAGDRARVLLELADGTITVGTQNGLSFIEDGEVRSFTDFEYPAILSLLETDSGSVLAGSDGGGIYEVKAGGEVVSHSFEDGLNEGVVLRMLKDGGEGYFISAGSSLYYMKDGSFRKLENLEKGPGSIFDFYLTDGRLWLLQNNGILAVNREDLLGGGTGEPVTYGFEYGLSGSLNANTWHCLTGGELYLATRNGISVFGFTAPENELPKVIITSIVVDGTVYDNPADTVTVSSGAQRITVNFAALSYTDTTRFGIGYMLDGFDEKEISAGEVKSDSVSYTNLSGGKYKFSIRVTDPSNMTDAAAGNTCGIEIVKEKKITEHPIFWVAAVFLVAAAAMGSITPISAAKVKIARRRQREYQDILEQSLLTFAGTIDAKDKYTNGHSIRVARYSRELARRMGMSPEEQEHIYYVALLHDIGKIGIPDHILNKPGKLNPEEREVIQTHPKIGAEILKNFTALKGIAEGAKYHHERYEGGGYCEGIAGEEIPLVARIIGVADTYDAMSSERCYRKPLSKDYIESELEGGKGTQFDPDIVPHMLDMIKDGTAERLMDIPME